MADFFHGSRSVLKMVANSLSLSSLRAGIYCSTPLHRHVACHCIEQWNTERLMLSQFTVLPLIGRSASSFSLLEPSLHAVGKPKQLLGEIHVEENQGTGCQLPASPTLAVMGGGWLENRSWVPLRLSFLHDIPNALLIPSKLLKPPLARGKATQYISLGFCFPCLSFLSAWCFSYQLWLSLQGSLLLQQPPWCNFLFNSKGLQ